METKEAVIQPTELIHDERTKVPVVKTRESAIFLKLFELLCIVCTRASSGRSLGVLLISLLLCFAFCSLAGSPSEVPKDLLEKACAVNDYDGRPKPSASHFWKLLLIFCTF